MGHFMVLFSSTNMVMSSSMSSMSSPMKMMTMILMIIWMLSIQLLSYGTSALYPIFTIMLFNGGLMVLYLFILSMIPKEKEKTNLNFPLKFTILSLMISKLYTTPKQDLKGLYFNKMSLMMFSSIIMVIMFANISMMMGDFFKTMKSHQ